MRSYTIIQNGLVSGNYGFSANGDSTDTIRQIGEKTAMVVTLSADGKEDKTFYHEIESIDSEIISNNLEALAVAYLEEIDAQPASFNDVVTNQPVGV